MVWITGDCYTYGNANFGKNNDICRRKWHHVRSQMCNHWYRRLLKSTSGEQTHSYSPLSLCLWSPSITTLATKVRQFQINSVFYPPLKYISTQVCSTFPFSHYQISNHLRQLFEYYLLPPVLQSDSQLSFSGIFSSSRY